MELFNNSGIDDYILEILSANLSIFVIMALVILLIYKFHKGNSSYIIISSLLFSISIVISSTGNTEIIDNLYDETLLNFNITLVSTICIMLSMLVFDKICLRNVEDKDNYLRNIMLSSVIISNSIIIRSLIIWADNISPESLALIFMIYSMYQILNIISALIYLRLHSTHKSFCKMVNVKDIPEIISYAGYNIGFSLTLASVCVFVPYDIMTNEVLIKWIKFAIIISCIYITLTLIINKMLKITIREKNEIEMLLIRSLIFISISFIVASLIW